MLSIDFKPGEKLYEQIYDRLKAAISDGYYQSGDQLPSLRAYADHLGVSLNTVKTAYFQLLEEGYIISKERCGFFVDKIELDHLGPREAVYPQYLTEEKAASPWRYDFSPSAVDLEGLARTGLQQAASLGMAQASRYQQANPLGEAPLRNALAHYLYEFRGLATSAENIVITRGFSHNLLALNQVFGQACYGLEDPGYALNLASLHANFEGTEKIPIDRYGFSVKDLEQTPANIAVVSPNHQFPTGQVMGVRRRQRLLNWASERPDRYIIEDDYDSVFKYAGRRIPAMKAIDRDDRVILSGSFSKSIGPFMGLAYMVLPDALLDAYATCADLGLTPSIASQLTLSQWMAEGAFTKHVNRMNTYYRKKQGLILDALQELPGLSFTQADTGLYLVFRLDPDCYDLDQLTQTWQAEGLKIDSVASYSRQLTWPWADYLLGLGGVPLADLPQALEVLGQSLEGSRV